MIDKLVSAYNEHLDDTFNHNPSDADYSAYIRRGVDLLWAANELGYNLRYVGRTFDADLAEKPGYVKAVPFRVV